MRRIVKQDGDIADRNGRVLSVWLLALVDLAKPAERPPRLSRPLVKRREAATAANLRSRRTRWATSRQQLSAMTSLSRPRTSQKLPLALSKPVALKIGSLVAATSRKSSLTLSWTSAESPGPQRPRRRRQTSRTSYWSAKQSGKPRPSPSCTTSTYRTLKEAEAAATRGRRDLEQKR